jgi:hypothetical protein
VNSVLVLVVVVVLLLLLLLVVVVVLLLPLPIGRAFKSAFHLQLRCRQIQCAISTMTFLLALNLLGHCWWCWLSPHPKCRYLYR